MPISENKKLVYLTQRHKESIVCVTRCVRFRMFYVTPIFGSYEKVCPTSVHIIGKGKHLCRNHPVTRNIVFTILET